MPKDYEEDMDEDMDEEPEEEEDDGSSVGLYDCFILEEEIEELEAELHEQLKRIVSRMHDHHEEHGKHAWHVDIKAMPHAEDEDEEDESEGQDY